MRNASSKAEIFCSKAGLERDGPQCVGCLKAAWLSMSTRAEGSVKARGCMFVCLDFSCLAVFCKYLAAWYNSCIYNYDCSGGNCGLVSQLSESFVAITERSSNRSFFDDMMRSIAWS